MAGPSGPYCVVVQGMPANCRFYDEVTCARAAVIEGGGCVARTAFATPLNSAPKDAGYCLVSHGDAKCFYYDAASCAKAAQLEGGTCLTRPRLATAAH
jgi:hypothetical protein